MASEFHSRRRVLALGAGLVAGSVLTAGAATGTVAAAGEETDLAAWLDGVENAGEAVDRRGQAEVTVEVGAEGNGGAFAFDPAVVRVDPGATVVWTWSGKGGMHNVAAADGSFESDLLTETGATFEFTPAAPGVVPYACAPHASMGMKGAVVCGDVAVTLPSASGAGDGAGADGASDGPDQEAGADATDSPSETFGGWLANTDNYRGLVDRRGQAEVTVEVGAEGNGGPFAFEPAAIHVDPGTTVVWEWVGSKAYDVVDEGLGYRSEHLASQGHRFAVAVDGHGVSRYGCTAYGDRGMRGVVVVGDGERPTFTTAGLAALGGAAAAVAAPLGYGLREHVRDTRRS